MSLLPIYSVWAFSDETSSLPTYSVCALFWQIKIWSGIYTVYVNCKYFTSLYFIYTQAIRMSHLDFASRQNPFGGNNHHLPNCSTKSPLWLPGEWGREKYTQLLISDMQRRDIIHVWVTKHIVSCDVLLICTFDGKETIQESVCLVNLTWTICPHKWQCILQLSFHVPM